ncbi:hypothetical protein H0486_14085 [Lachnospiraceae bacterium MD1]|jgi:hypothetical protein|uniref:Uncharacterized protein n=1 Tax=Variimorphobacter saccharofermentans TaxID=2755051 RepID=A0A839K264_9FIRM|nr:hypothetical protein [Variimorphobacter saccharofermentans]MBB2184005.1 hypothetical protein [Variimorphobacter saccharofermentans]
MKNYDYWKTFVKTGKIDDYLHYIACTQEESMEDIIQAVDTSGRSMDRDKEGGMVAGINYRDGNGFIGHAGW